MCSPLSGRGAGSAARMLLEFGVEAACFCELIFEEDAACGVDGRRSVRDHDLAVGFAVLDIGHRCGSVCEGEGSIEHGAQNLLVVE